jgi:hypothetical protein
MNMSDATLQLYVEKVHTNKTYGINIPSQLSTRIAGMGWWMGLFMTIND